MGLLRIRRVRAAAMRAATATALVVAGLPTPARAQDRWEGELPSVRHAPPPVEPLAIHEVDLRAGGTLWGGFVLVHRGVGAQYPAVSGDESVDTVYGALRFSRARVVAPGAATWFVVGGEAVLQRSRTWGAPQPQWPFLYDVGQFVFRGWESGAYLNLGVRWATRAFTFHVQLDRAIGVLGGHAQFDLRTDLAGRAAVVRRHGSEDYAVLATRYGLEIGWPLRPPSHALRDGAPVPIVRVRLEVLWALNRPKLRLHGDSFSSARYDPSHFALALGLGLAF